MLFLVVLWLYCSYVVISVAARVAIIKQSLEVLFFLNTSTLLLLFWTPTLSHISGFEIYTDVWNKNPSHLQRFVFCLYSPHHSLMTLTDMALTVFIFSPPLPLFHVTQRAVKQRLIKVIITLHLTAQNCLSHPSDFLNLPSPSVTGFPLIILASLTPIADYFCNCPPSLFPFLIFFLGQTPLCIIFHLFEF